MKKVICFLLIVSSSIAFAQESALLRYNYKKGKYKMTLVMKQNLGFPGEMNMKMESDINVISSENNKFQLSTSLVMKIHKFAQWKRQQQ